MLKRRALVMFLVVLMLALPVVAAAASAVEFEDDNLEEAVIEEFANLGKVLEESKIPQADMKLLTEIDACLDWETASADTEIRDLTGLEYAINLDILCLADNFIKDLSPIRNLPLSFLDISGNDKEWDAAASSPAYIIGTPAFSYNPSSPQMRILQEIQHRGAVVDHDGLVSRISGPDRYQTAIRIWQNMYTSGYDSFDVGNTIVLARGDDFADALVGAPLAYELGAPILLTTSNKLHPATKAALISYIEKFEDDLTAAPFNGVFDVYVLGKEAAVSDAVVNELIYAIETEFEALDVRAIRIGGADRYATSVAIAKKIDPKFETDDEIIIASGEDFPDALSAAPYAADEGMPILLTRGDKLPDCVVDYLKDLGKDQGAFDAVVAGGAAAISENVIDQLVKLKYRDAGANKDVFTEVTRVWGADRYATSVELGKHYGALTSKGKIAPIEDTNDGFFYVATGENFADALTGAVLAAQKETGILLVKQDTIPSSVEKAMNFQSNTVDQPTAALTILGGEAAVSLYNAVKMYNLVRYPAWAPR